MPGQTNQPAWREHSKTWQQREKEKVETHLVFRGSQNISERCCSINSSPRRSSSSSAFSSHTPSPAVIWVRNPPSQSNSWTHHLPLNLTLGPTILPPPPTNGSTILHHIPPSQSNCWPSHGNSSNSPLSHKFSGMGLRDVFNANLAQEMDKIGMGSS